MKWITRIPNSSLIRCKLYKQLAGGSCNGLIKMGSEYEHFLIVDKGIVVGMFYYRIRGRKMYVCNVVVDKCYRGIGYGRRIMEMVKFISRIRKCKEITLGVLRDNLVAYRLYEKSGFVIYKEDKKHYYMKYI